MFFLNAVPIILNITALTSITIATVINGLIALSPIVSSTFVISNSSVFSICVSCTNIANILSAAIAIIRIINPGANKGPIKPLSDIDASLSITNINTIRTNATAIAITTALSTILVASDNISITDSNGNVYSSLVRSIDDQLSKLQENDTYMQNKVAAQLDMLVGRGNYVVTVSTFLNQVPVQETSIKYDPNSKTSVTEQTFREGLGDKSQDSSRGTDAVSVYLPNGLQSSSANSSQNRNYERTATETSYGVGKIHTSKYYETGIIEKVSIAVTLNAGSMPPNMTEKELKEQIARSASPKVTAADVSIAYSETVEPYLSSDRPVNLPQPDETGNPWWIAIVVVVVGLLFGFIVVSRKIQDVSFEQEEALKHLQRKTEDQEKQITDVNLKAAELIEKQTVLTQELIEQQKQLQIERKRQPKGNLDEIVQEVSSDIQNADSDKTLQELKSWIERS